MKKFIYFFITILMTICLFSIPASANDEISVILDGEMLEFDVQPQVINGRTMVPMRKIFESLGATVEWNGDTQKIKAMKENTMVIMQINNNILTVNGNTITLDVPPIIVNTKTFVPVRAVAESFDIHVIWDGDTKTVLLSSYIPFSMPKQAFDYLCNWLVENGEAFGEYVCVGWTVTDGVQLSIRCYPESGNIAFCLDSFESDRIVTTVNLWPTYNGTDIYATYISGDMNSAIQGYINMDMHTSNYPLTYETCAPGELYGTTYNMLEDTRKRINYLLNECDILLAYNNTKVNLNTLGFKKH